MGYGFENVDLKCTFLKVRKMGVVVSMLGVLTHLNVPKMGDIVPI